MPITTVKGEIANALTSIAPDHILGVTHDIYDEDMQKYQDAINRESVDGSVLGYPTFSVTDSYAVGEIVFHIRKLYRFTSAHAPGAWNSSHVEEYDIAEAINTSDAGIYDVTAKNNGATFESLSDLLGRSNLSTLIPSEYRKGGMSMRFVQSVSTYTVEKTEGLTNQPSGTQLTTNPNVNSGTYTGSQLTAFAAAASLPTSTGAGNAVTYYMEVSGDSTTYTSWVITFVSKSDNKYVQYQLIKNSFDVNPINWVKTEPDYINSSGVCYDFNNNEAAYSAFYYCPLKAGETYIIQVEKEQSSALLRTSETGSGSPSTYKEQISANYGITEFTPQYNTNYIFFFLSIAQVGRILICNKKRSASLFTEQISNIKKDTNLLCYKITTSAAQNAWKPYYIKNGDKLIVYNNTNSFCFLDLREAATGNKDKRYSLNAGLNEISISELPNQVSRYISIYAGESTADKYIYIIKEENTETSLSQFIPQILQSKNDEVELSGRVTTLENKTNIIKQTLSAEGYTGWVPFNVTNGDSIVIESEAPDGSVIVLFNSTQSNSYAFRAFPNKGKNEITATADTKYVRMFFADSAKNKYVRVIKKVTGGSLAEETLQNQADIVQLDDTVKSINASKVFYVGTGRQYTTIKAGVEAALQYPNSIVYIERGTYDIIQEWGESVLDNQTETIQNNGIKLYNGIHLIFSSDAKVVCNYTGNNQYACDDFSPFNSLMSFQDEKGGFTIENMNIECSRVRYCVHDERGSRADDRYKHVYKNCKFYIDNSNNPSLPDREWCIGTGLGRDGYIIVEGCEFARGNYYAHNTGNADAKSKIIVKDCIFASGNTVRLDPYGTSTKETDVYVSNCRLGASIIKSQPSSGNPDNIKVIEWNNTIVES